MNLCKKNECTGCYACKQSCLKDAISFHEAEMGFKYPEIDDSKCISCGKCQTVCHVYSSAEYKHEPKKIFRYKGDNDIRLVSSSGGFFSLLANYLLADDYYIAGVVFDDDYLGAHFEITNSDKRVWRMRKSKYVEAKIGAVFKEAETLLQKGKKVLFVGLPCQVAGFLKFLHGRFLDNVFTVDLVCFGSGSPQIYKESLIDFARRKKKNSTINKVDFRHKPFINCTHTIADIELDGEKYIIPSNEFPYYYGYVNRLVLRESCYDCHYQSYARVSDITIGDVPGDLDPLGENLVLCNTQKGLQITETLSDLKHDKCFISVENEYVDSMKLRFESSLTRPSLYGFIKKAKRYRTVEVYMNIHYLITLFKKKAFIIIRMIRR